MGQLREEASLAGIIIRWVLFFVLLGFLVGGVSLWLTGSFSNWIGKTNQQIQINSSTNRTGQYEAYLRLFHSIRTQAQAADLARKSLARFEQQHPDATADSFQAGQQRGELSGNADGAAQVCLGTVNEYNTKLADALSQHFADSRLPTNVSTDVCTDLSKMPAQIQGEGEVPQHGI